ncbi:FAD-dependent oxidoreductase [bacterium]|nr:FAD-dependent oxidoreductase [bacterium]
MYRRNPVSPEVKTFTMGKLNGLVDVIETAAPPKTEPKPEKKGIPRHGSYDAIIIGGGPSGMTAGVYLARKRIKTLLISPDLGGQVLWTSSIENYPGYDVISGWDLATHFREQLEEQEIDILNGDSVVSMQITSEGGMVSTEQGGKYTFRALIVASGKRSRPLDVPGEQKLKGRGVTYCATCDGPLYRGQEVAVVGGGNSALTAAIDLLNLGCMVHLVNTMPTLQADAVLIEKARNSEKLRTYLESDVVEILGNTEVTGITVHDLARDTTLTLPVTGVFIEIGLSPNSSFAKGILTMNDNDEIMVNCLCQTNIPGIFAAGDVTSVPDKQIIIAAGEGAKAALGVSDYLMKK